MKRLLASTALILALAAISLANAPDVRFASGKSALNIPFRIVNNHIYLHVTVNNDKPLWFLLDTGAVNIINQRLAKPLGLKLTPAGQTSGVGEGVADFFVTGNISYSLPGVTVTKQQFSVISLENVEECLRKIEVDVQGQITRRAQVLKQEDQQTLDGVLGAEFLRMFVVEIDYVTKTINLYDPDSFRYQGDGEKIPLQMRGAHIYVRTPISAATHSDLRGLFMIDSGSAVAVVLNRPFIEQNNLLPPANETKPFPVCGVGGESPTQIGKIRELRLGKISVENPMAMFSQAQNGVLARSDFSGQIGSAILRRFKVVFDYSRKVMILERPKGSG